MKCIRCDHDSKYSERAGGICPKCNGRFAFEPKSGDPFTDRGFQSAIGAVSGDGTVKFLPSHVWYQLNRPIEESLFPAAFVTALALAAATELQFAQPGGG